MKFFNTDQCSQRAIAITATASGFADAEATLSQSRLQLQEAEKLQRERLEEMRAAQTGLSELQKWLDSRERQFFASASDKWADAVLNPVCDVSGLATALRTTQTEIEFARCAINHGRTVILPKVQIKQLRANFDQLSVKSDIATQEAVLACAERHNAARALTALGEVVTFEPLAGRTNELYELARRAYLIAVEAQKSLRAAEAAFAEVNGGSK